VEKVRTEFDPVFLSVKKKICDFFFLPSEDEVGVVQKRYEVGIVKIEVPELCSSSNTRIVALLNTTRCSTHTYTHHPTSLSILRHTHIQSLYIRAFLRRGRRVFFEARATGADG
jgi:hypothetical protein